MITVHAGKRDPQVTEPFAEYYDPDMGRVVGAIPQPPAEPESILQEAHRLTHGDRNTTYGEPYDDYKCVGRVLGAQLEKWLRSEGFDITVPDVPPHVAANFMASGVKGCRLAQKTAKRDSFVDQAGYSDVGYRSYVQQERNANQSNVRTEVIGGVPMRIKHSTK